LEKTVAGAGTGNEGVRTTLGKRCLEAPLNEHPYKMSHGQIRDVHLSLSSGGNWGGKTGVRSTTLKKVVERVRREKGTFPSGQVVCKKKGRVVI